MGARRDVRMSTCIQQTELQIKERGETATIYEWQNAQGGWVPLIVICDGQVKVVSPTGGVYIILFDDCTQTFQIRYPYPGDKHLTYISERRGAETWLDTEGMPVYKKSRVGMPENKSGIEIDLHTWFHLRYMRTDTPDCVGDHAEIVENGSDTCKTVTITKLVIPLGMNKAQYLLHDRVFCNVYADGKVDFLHPRTGKIVVRMNSDFWEILPPTPTKFDRPSLRYQYNHDEECEQWFRGGDREFTEGFVNVLRGNGGRDAGNELSIQNIVRCCGKEDLVCNVCQDRPKSSYLNCGSNHVLCEECVKERLLGKRPAGCDRPPCPLCKRSVTVGEIKHITALEQW